MLTIQIERRIRNNPAAPETIKNIGIRWFMEQSSLYKIPITN
jgi:hypothetical protein